MTYWTSCCPLQFGQLRLKSVSEAFHPDRTFVDILSFSRSILGSYTKIGYSHVKLYFADVNWDFCTNNCTIGCFKKIKKLDYVRLGCHVQNGCCTVTWTES